MNVVQTLAQATANIVSYNEAIRSSNSLPPTVKEDLLRTLTMATSWFAIRTASGWLLGPAKYVGADSITPEFYSQNRTDRWKLDGTEGEKALKKLIKQGARQPISVSHPAALALSALVARVGKSPKSSACVYILDDAGADENRLAEKAKALPPMVAGLIEAITSFAPYLPPEGIAALKLRVASL